MVFYLVSGDDILAFHLVSGDGILVFYLVSGDGILVFYLVFGDDIFVFYLVSGVAVPGQSSPDRVPPSSADQKHFWNKKIFEEL